MMDSAGERTTKYSLLANELREHIESGVLGPGGQLPSYSELRLRHGASLATVDRALSILEKEGLVVRINGRGTFVTEHRHPAVAASVDAGEAPFIGLILPRRQEEVFFEPIIHGLEEECQASGYDLIVANSKGYRELEAQLLLKMSRQTAGLCIMPSRQADPSAFAGLLARRVPFVLLDRTIEGLDVPFVANDNEKGGYLATKHLLELGRKRIYVMSRSPEGLSSLSERIAGYRRALKEAEMPFDPALVRHLPEAPDEAGYRLTQEIIASGLEKEPFAIFALNEAVASGCYLALHEAGLKIPADVAVVGFDNVFAELFDPPLTAVHQDLIGIGRATARRLIEGIRTGGLKKARVQRLQPELIVRGSSDVRALSSTDPAVNAPQLQSLWTTRLLASRQMSRSQDEPQPAPKRARLRA